MQSHDSHVSSDPTHLCEFQCNSWGDYKDMDIHTSKHKLEVHVHTKNQKPYICTVKYRQSAPTRESAPPRIFASEVFGIVLGAPPPLPPTEICCACALKHLRKSARASSCDRGAKQEWLKESDSHRTPSSISSMLSAGTETTEAFKPHPQHIECACALERGRYHGTIITRYRVSAPQLIFSVLVHQEGGRSDGTLRYISPQLVSVYLV